MMLFLWKNVFVLYQEEKEAFQGECVSLPISRYKGSKVVRGGTWQLSLVYFLEIVWLSECSKKTHKTGDDLFLIELPHPF